MKPLIVLLVVFMAALGITFLMQGTAAVNLSGRIAMSLMLLLTSFGHFKFSKGMAMMMPPFIPAKKQLVLLTGYLEIAAAICLLIPAVIKITGILLMAFFVLILPANIYAASKKVDLEKADHSGQGKNYLWFRIPLQLLFIGWVYWFAVK
jgi:uncharacterized membrane protein